ncbi:MAG: hypothetical protein JWM98_1529 [Thermoleophilia bacterium]|nr:hypothetical protein [Thermoleophilia bacterium]
MDDELEIRDAAERRLLPWFDTVDELERWAIDQLLVAADDMRLLREQPRAWGHVQTKKRLRESLHFVEAVGAPVDALLLYDVVPDGVTLEAAWTRGLEVRLSRHARERLHERVDELEPDPEQQRRWLSATVERALRDETLTLDAPRWAASAPLRPGFGWTTRMLQGDEIALLVAAPHYEGGAWNIVTVLSKSTAISPAGRLVRWWKRGSRLMKNRLHYGTPAPTREMATRPPVLGDVSPMPRRSRSRR